MAANWIINELFGRLKKEDHDITESPVSAAQLGQIVDLIASDRISGKIAKDVFEIMVETGHGDPRPFIVQTRDGSLLALGTRFMVKREDDGTRLSVLRSPPIRPERPSAPSRRRRMSR